MSVRGYYKARIPGTLKGAEAALIGACGGPVAAAGIPNIGIAKTALHVASDKDHPDRHLSVEIALRLEAHCGQPIVSSFMLAERGYLAEQVEAKCSDPLPVVVGRLTTETGELLSAAARDMAAGALTRANAINVLRETDEVVPALLQLRALARQVVDGDGAI